MGGIVGLTPLIVSLPSAAVLPQDGRALVLVAAIAIGASLLPMTAYAVAAPRVGGAKAAAAGALELPAMFVLGWLLLAETVTAGQLVAGVLIVSAVVATPVSDGPVESVDSGDPPAPESLMSRGPDLAGAPVAVAWTPDVTRISRHKSDLNGELGALPFGETILEPLGDPAPAA
jgi:hypothetical protein